ncbi:Ig-like domain-containing protein [Azospirillum doebereinerae]
MFDAAGAVTSEGAAHADATLPQPDHAQPAADPAFLDALAQAVPVAAARPDTAPPVADATPAAAPAPASAAPPDAGAAEAGAGRHEVMFVDPTVADYQTLVDGARPGVEVVVLDPSRDGLVQMAEYLEGRSGIDSVQIMAHGSAGRFALGAVDVNADTLQTHGAELAIIGRALTGDGDILIYACNTGAGIDGQGFVIDLAAATGADVAASSDNTGAAALGGNWVLETRAGTIESTVALTAQAQDRYAALMTATFTLQTGGANTVSALGTVATKTFIAADFDGDGDTDFIFRNNSASPTGVDFWRNSGGVFTKFSGAVSGNPFSAITWSGPNSAVLAANFSPFSMLATDVDGDGDIDVVNMASGNARGIWLNNSGIFSYATGSPTLPTVTANTQSVAGDFDGDGDIDVILRNNTGAPTGVDFWRNDGGTFTKISSTATNNPFSAITFAALAASFDARFMAAGDVDGDGDIDVINMTSANGRGIWLNNGGVFSIVSAGCLPVGTTSGQFVAGDFDGDGDTDIAFRNASGTGIDFYRASGGTFTLDTSGSPFSAIAFSGGGTNNNFNADLMTTLDIDGDGDLDIVNLASTAGRGTFHNDLTPPQLTSVTVGGVTVSNADNPTGAGTTPTITLNFNKDIQSAGTGQISIRKYSDGSLVGSVTANDTSKVSGVNAGVGSSSTITITPGVTLDAGTRYYIQIDKGAFSDSDGATLGRVDVINNATMGLTGKTLFDFTTNTAPTLDLNGAGAGTGNTVTLAAAASGLAGATATAADAENDSANWNGATLTVKRSATAGTTNGAWSSDTFDFTGASGITIDGGDLKSGATTIGTATNSGGTLTVTFNGSATSALVTSVVKGVTYGNGTPAGNATITFALTDGSGNSTSADVSVTSSTINVTSTTDTATIDVTDGVSFSEAVAIANAQSGADTLVMGSGFTGAMTLAGDLTVAESLTVNADAAGGWTVQDGVKTITLNSGATLTVTNSSGTVTIESALSGSGGLTKSGGGTLALGSTSHTGSVTVGGGTLSISSGTSIGDSSAVTVNSGATLKLAGGAETIGSLSGAGSVVLGYKLTVGDANTSTSFSGVISGSGNDLTKTGTGTLTLSGANTYTGSTTVSAGQLTLEGGASLADASAVTVASGATLRLQDSDETIGSLAGAGTVTLNGGSLTAGGNNSSTSFSGGVADGSVGAQNLTKTGTGTLTLSGSNSYGGTTTVSGGTLSVAGDGNLGGGTVTLNGGTLAVTGTGTIDNAVALGVGNGTVSVGTGITATLSGTVGGAGGLTKTGAGTLTLSGSGSYAGTTTVSAGTLLVTGTLDPSGNVSVGSGATLGGTGTLFSSGSKQVTILDGATLAPGVAGTNNGIGTLTINGTLRVNGTLAVEVGGSGGVAGTDYDQVAVNGTVSLNGGSLSVSRVNGYTATSGTVFRIIDNDGSDAVAGSPGTFGSIAEGTDATLGGDLYTVRYASGTGNDVTLSAVVNPTVSSVSATTADGTYKAGDTVAITVTFNRAVTVTGSPILALGNNGRTAAYSAGSGGTTLTFAYTVQAGDTSADLDYLSTAALSLNGGAILDAGTSLAAVLTLATPGAANSLGANRNIVIDTTGPAVVSVSAPPDGTYGAGRTMDFVVTFNEAVAVDGTPTLPITLDNGEVVQATYLSGAGGTALTFRYTVGSGKLDADGIAVGVALGGGTVKDTVGNAATPTLNGVAATGGVRIDAVAPAVTAVTAATANGAYATGDTVTLQVIFSEAVTVTGTPTLALNTGRTAAYGGGSGGSTLSFTYTVQAGDTSADLDAGALGLNGGTITDAAGNAATLGLPGAPNSLGAGKDIVIDTRAPEVLTVIVPNDGTYGAGRTLSFFVSLSEAVTVAGGTPTIAIDVGGVARQAVYNAVGSVGTVLRFDYVVQAGDADPDGIAVGALSLNGATIADAARNPLPALLANLPGTQGVRIDTAAPAAPSAPALAPGSDSGASASDLVTNVTRPTLTGTAEAGSTVTVLIDGVARGTATAGADGAWSLALSTPLAEGAWTITTTATDAAGNVGPASPALVVTIDATPPLLSIPTLAAGSDNGISTADRITSVTRPTLTGTAEPNGTVTVLIDGAAAGTATAGSDGVWSLTLASALSDGDHSVQAAATDLAGNTGRSASQTVTIRTAAPATPSAPVLSAGSDSGASSGDALTSVTKPTLTGAAEPNATVTLFVDGTAAGTTRSDAGGAWSLTLGTALADGAHRIQVGVTDAAGNSGAALSGALVVTVDSQAPTIATTPPATGLGSGTTVTVGAGVTLSDASLLDRMTVTLTDARSGDELVIGVLPGGITATRDGSQVVLSGVASTADYQAALRMVGLRSTAADPAFNGSAPSRSITLSARDAAGNESVTATVTVAVNSAVTAVAPNTGTNSTTMTISGNGPSSNSPSADSTGAGLPGASSLPGAASSGGDSRRSVTLGSIDGATSSGDSGRSVTLGSIGGSASSGDSGRFVTLSSLGGQTGGESSSSASGLTSGTGGIGFGGGTGLGGGLDTGFGGGIGGGLGGPGTGTDLATGFGTASGQPQPLPAQGNPAAGTGRGTEPGGNRPGGQPQSEPNGTPGTPQGGNPDGEQGETGTAPNGGAPPTQGPGTGARAEVPAIRFAPGFAHQVARVQGGPADASALLAALADHILPGNRAA